MHIRPDKLVLRTFGGLSLETAGRPLLGAAVQRGRLAILAVLAVAGSRGISRDKLLALFWPESDEERARGSLKQALYALRRDVGEHELTLGTTELRLNPDVISSDVCEFEAALQRGDHAAAVGLYTGPFLDSVLLRSLTDFEEWSDYTRLRLQQSFRSALESLASEASARGDHVFASRWWQRCAAEDRLSERVARCCMEALVASGERERAIRHGQIYIKLVRAELNSAPGDGFVSYLSRLANGKKDLNLTMPVSTLVTTHYRFDGTPDAGPHAEPPVVIEAGHWGSPGHRIPLHVPTTLGTSESLQPTEGVQLPQTPIIARRRRQRAAVGVFATLSVVVGATLTRQLPQRAMQKGADASEFVAIVEFLGIKVAQRDSALSSIAALVSTDIDSTLLRVGGIDVRHTTIPSSRAPSPSASDRYRLTGFVERVPGSSDSIFFRLRLVDLNNPRLATNLPLILGAQADLPTLRSVLAERLSGTALALVEKWTYPEQGPVLGHELPPTQQAHRLLLDALRAFDRNSVDESLRILRTISVLAPSYSTPRVVAAMVLGAATQCDSSLALAQSMNPESLAPGDRMYLEYFVAFCRGDLTSVQSAISRYTRVVGPKDELALVWSAVNAARGNAMHRADSLITSGPVPATRKNFFLHQTVFHALGQPQREQAMLSALANPSENQNEDVRRAALVESYASQGRFQDVEKSLLDFQALTGRVNSEGIIMSRAASEYEAHGYPVAARQMRLRALRAFRLGAVTNSDPVEAFQLALALVDTDSLEAARPIILSLLTNRVGSPLLIEAAHGLLGVAAARTGDKDVASHQLDWLASQGNKSHRGNPTIWRARISLVLGRRDDALNLARKAIAEGYGRWFPGTVRAVAVPIHQIRDFSWMAYEGLR